MTEGVGLAADCHMEVRTDCADADRLRVWLGGSGAVLADRLGAVLRPLPLPLGALSGICASGAVCMCTAQV